MARISKYAQDTTLNDKDLLAGSNYISGSLGEEVYSTTNFTLGGIKSYIGTTTGSYNTITRTFTGSELVDAFNGNSSDSITLVSVPADKIAIVKETVIIVKASSTGTTNYNANNSLYVVPSGATSGWGTTITAAKLNAANDYISLSIDAGTATGLNDSGGAGADIILGTPDNTGPCTITAGDRDVILSVVYRLIDI
jgi:hypothetical protein